MPNNQPPIQPEYSAPRKARDEVQLTLGQIHGVVWLAVNEVDAWLERSPTTGGDPELTVDDIRHAATEVHAHFGTVQAALNTGAYDEELVRVGLGGAQGQAKRKGLLSNIARFASEKTRKMRNYLGRLRNSLRWSSTIIGSISVALKKEVERVPGAAAAAEAIREFIEVLLNATEPAEADDQQAPPDRGPRKVEVEE